MVPAIDRGQLSGPCHRGHHEGCQSHLTCECRCHLTGVRPPAPIAPVVKPDIEAARAAGFTWAEPPPRWSRGGKPLLTEPQAQLLRSHPGEWALIRSFPSESGAHQARKRWADNPGGHPPDQFEVRARRDKQGQSHLYVRARP